MISIREAPLYCQACASGTLTKKYLKQFIFYKCPNGKHVGKCSCEGAMERLVHEEHISLSCSNCGYKIGRYETLLGTWVVGKNKL